MKNQGKLYVFELNEISPKVINDYVKHNPRSSLAEFISQSEFYTTIADDISEDELYPAQSWASLNSGVPFNKHRIKWYNDPKNKALQIWDQLSTKFTSGLINVIHSSSYKNTKSFNYFLADPYEKNDFAIPNCLIGFQRFKNVQTFKSGRVSKFSITFSEIKDILSFAFKIRAITYYRIFKILYDFKIKGLNERLRNVEFLLHFDIFLWALKNKSSDINVFFTNHVASQMHRYLGASYPTKTIINSFGEAWVKKYSSEVNFSIDLFDKTFDEFKKSFLRADDTVVLVSSMGQGVINNFKNNYITQYVSDPKKFWKAFIGSEFIYKQLGAMVPQLTIKLSTKDEAFRLKEKLKQFDHDQIISRYDINDNTLTVSTDFKGLNSFHIGKKVLSPQDLGIKTNLKDSQNTGKHIKEGIFIVHSKHKLNLKINKFSYLEYKSMIHKLVHKNFILRGNV